MINRKSPESEGVYSPKLENKIVRLYFLRHPLLLMLFCQKNKVDEDVIQTQLQISGICGNGAGVIGVVVGQFEGEAAGVGGVVVGILAKQCGAFALCGAIGEGARDREWIDRGGV